MSSIENIDLTPQWKNDSKNVWYQSNGCTFQKDNSIVEYLEEWKSPCYNENKEYINFRIEENKEELIDVPILENRDKPHQIAYKIFYKVGNWMEYVYPHMYQINENYYDSDFESDEYDMEDENNDHNDYNENNDYDDDYKNSLPDYS